MYLDPRSAEIPALWSAGNSDNDDEYNHYEGDDDVDDAKNDDDNEVSSLGQAEKGDHNCVDDDIIITK